MHRWAQPPDGPAKARGHRNALCRLALSRAPQDLAERMLHFLDDRKQRFRNGVPFRQLFDVGVGHFRLAAVILPNQNFERKVYPDCPAGLHQGRSGPGIAEDQYNSRTKRKPG